ncbi:hypothetical protein N4G70_36080 [Streptomyces sp. ASQP_92]|uniref:hypothetical protein n=1 Tax=Streptomyces sp. ASQP_92 TaxID=2979116 RepID=UPI0021BED417|nr:hypothetical protein [Streptomyces sp. ASQP_92]MCT9094221.1 hypothetical protein [Streptomyces sp. ASQP_92]
MTKTGSDHLKRRARDLARTTGRRYPDVLAELRGAPRSKPGAALVLVCSGLAHPLDGGRCVRPADHLQHDGGWGYCSLEAHHPSHIWAGYFRAREAAERARHEAWLASLTPEQRAVHEAEEEAAYWAQMADDAAEPYDPEEERSLEYALDAADEARWAAEAEAQEDGRYGEDEWDEDYR